MQQQGRKHRSSTELIASVLEATAGIPEGELSTKVMYKSNTNQKELKEYLENLLRFELLEYENRRYRITDKGKKFLELYDRLRQELRNLE